ncbi:hypothetical protein [Bacillus thuringiensis]|uniref:hypothetical protein n=1 Tax=Bacillus thuringiensis TaxID=1428 RepID=UPI00159BC9B3|nr:hypothetical protein [Bacillus thuringiensis]
MILSDNAVDIDSKITNALSDEKEVVAPMSEEIVKEILSFEEFIEKHGTGNLDYEKKK